MLLHLIPCFSQSLENTSCIPATAQWLRSNTWSTESSCFVRLAVAHARLVELVQRLLLAVLFAVVPPPASFQQKHVSEESSCHSTVVLRVYQSVRSGCKVRCQTRVSCCASARELCLHKRSMSWDALFRMCSALLMSSILQHLSVHVLYSLQVHKLRRHRFQLKKCRTVAMAMAPSSSTHLPADAFSASLLLPAVSVRPPVRGTIFIHTVHWNDFFISANLSQRIATSFNTGLINLRAHSNPPSAAVDVWLLLHHVASALFRPCPGVVQRQLSANTLTPGAINLMLHVAEQRKFPDVSSISFLSCSRLFLIQSFCHASLSPQKLISNKRCCKQFSNALSRGAYTYSEIKCDHIKSLWIHVPHPFQNWMSPQVTATRCFLLKRPAIPSTHDAIMTLDLRPAPL